MRSPTIVVALAIMLGGTAPWPAPSNAQGEVELSNGTKVPPNPSLPKLNLTNTQREQIQPKRRQKQTVPYPLFHRL